MSAEETSENSNALLRVLDPTPQSFDNCEGILPRSAISNFGRSRDTRRTDDELIEERLNIGEKLGGVSDSIGSFKECDQRFRDDFDRDCKVFVREHFTHHGGISISRGESKISLQFENEANVGILHLRLDERGRVRLRELSISALGFTDASQQVGRKSRFVGASNDAENELDVVFLWWRSRLVRLGDNREIEAC